MRGLTSIFDYVGRKPCLFLMCRIFVLTLVFGIVLLTGCSKGSQAITTFHYDNYRTGWNKSESTLTATNVSSNNFVQLSYAPIALDEQVDTQPLVVPGLRMVNGQGIGADDVVYVATENNSVYAIDGNTGKVLAQTNFGKPVPVAAITGCHNNGASVGINGTPVIDLSTNTMYVIAFTMDADGAAYHIHALDLATLKDKVSATEITATHPGAQGSTISFFPGSHRQRAALLLANGNIYAAFGSFCDFTISTSQPRGWILGWEQYHEGQKQKLTPLKSSIVTNEQTDSNEKVFLSSVWMSGSGLAADDDGSIYAVTGNTDSGTYNNGRTHGAPPGRNLGESVIKIAPDLSKVSDWFTPSNAADLDKADLDFGSGGVMLLPGEFSTPNGKAHLATAAGKFGTMYVLDATRMGHGGPGLAATPAPLAEEDIGYCFCSQSYFLGANGPTIVSSGGGFNWGSDPEYVPGTVHLWSVSNLLTPNANVPSASATLRVEDQGKSLDLTQESAQSAGFFTSVSGVGKDAIIWAVVRPDKNFNMTLYAFSQTVSNGTLTQLFKGQAGTWRNLHGNANTVPVVANGRVYVASYKELRVFGLMH